MRIARLAATLAAAGVLVLAGAAPSFADPVASVTPKTISAGERFTATLTDCDEDSAFIQTDLIGGNQGLDELGEGTFRAIFTTGSDTEPGKHTINFFCGETPAGSADLIVEGDEEPKPPFNADINPELFRGGDRLTLTTVNCEEVPTVEDVNGLFTSPLVLKEVGDLKHRGSAVTKTNLPPDKVFTVVVTCGDESVTFTTTPGKKPTKKRGGQTPVTPVGGVDTGDGSTAQGGSVLPMAISGSVVVLAAAALGVAYLRRKAQEDA
jgi:hypothetical protein